MQLSSVDSPVSLEELPIREQFRRVKEAGVFDYFDRIPLRADLDQYLSAMSEFDLPIHTASWFYQLGRDEALLADNLKICKEVGARCHNIMTFKEHADGHVLSNQEIADHYLKTYDLAASYGVEPSFELHVNMWTESFKRVEAVASLVMERGIPFNFTLDYSHVNFKIGNPEEQAVSEVREDVENGTVILDPFEPGSLCERWLEMGIVKWTQLRSVAPNQPKNLWHREADGNFARGIQYPFVKPQPGEWHSDWHAYLLEPSKEAIRKALRYHITHPDSPLRYITTEMINLPDYGLGARYNLLEQNIAAAKFIRRTWEEIKALHKAGLIDAGQKRQPQ
ncbi:hypothetical protein [Marinobacter sp. X15-166B]|uniref:hypothetical protein n=1 Tax=Marinobacter sp. X15-166B TaxID=1897620 RepID=UPI0018E90D35|nr:hypothetical protein [Marinobacter sp. X15-166B]